MDVIGSSLRSEILDANIEMFNTYNMGVGMTAVVAPEDADEAIRVLHEAGEDAYILGETVAAEEGGVTIC